MAASAIPGLDVEEQFGVRYPRSELPPSGPAGVAPDPAPMGPAQGIPEAGTAGSRLSGLRAAIPRPVAALGRVVSKAAPAAIAAQAMGGSFEPDSTARYAKRFGIDEPTGDGSVGDIARFAGLRALGYASDLGNTMTMGLAGKFYADNQPGAMPAATPVTPAPAAPSPAPAANPTDQRLAAGTQAAPSSLPPPIYVRNGNSFTGPDGGVKDGLRIGITPGMNDDAFVRGQRAAAIENQNSVLRGQLDAFGPGVHSADGTGGVADLGASFVADRAARNAEVRSVLGSNDPRSARFYAGLRNAADIARMQEGGATGRAVLGANTQRDVASLNANTQRAINERNVELGLRGQDMTYAGHMASNRLGIFNALREQGNADRQFGLQAQQQNFTERGEREKQLQGNLEKMFTTMDGDKPVVNQQAVQQARQGFDRSVARLGLDGPHQLSPMDEQRLMAGTSLLQKMRENAGWLPWQPDKLKTIDPVDLVGLRVLPNGDRQIARKGSNAFGQVIPRRFFTTEEGSRMGDWFGTGTPTNRYDLLSMGQ